MRACIGQDQARCRVAETLSRKHGPQSAITPEGCSVAVVPYEHEPQAYMSMPD